jgi:pimeloyl-ACP methyl ester carboxylesterase
VYDVDTGIHLVGHSYGGVVALAAALKDEFNIKKLTLFEPVAASVLKTFGYEDELKAITRFTEDYQKSFDDGEKYICARVIDFWGGPGSFEIIPEHIQKAMDVMTKNNLRHWTLCMNEIFDSSEYKHLNIPVSLIHGSQSNSIAKLISSALNHQLPNSELHVIENASHFMITTHAEECVEIINPSLSHP